MNRLSTCLLVILALAVLAPPASAQVSPDGTGEPAYTNTTTNRQYFSWPAMSSGIDGYRIKFSWYRDGVLLTDATYDQSTAGGTTWADWDGVATLVEGSTYGICAQGYFSFHNDSMYWPDGPNSCSTGTMVGKRTSTTIDRTAPAIATTLAGGAAATKQASVPLEIGFQDAGAGPFPANFVCVVAGSGPCESYSYSDACSTATQPGKNTSFSCQVDVSGLPDGPVKACVIAADASVPDNPNGSNQSGSATSANRSTAQCDTIVLDRTAPSLTLGGPTTAQVGQLLEFTSQAGDAGSGLGGQVQWTWGDNTQGTSGTSATHTFTQAGTYKVQAKVSDAAGNQALAEKVVTVTAPPAQPGPVTGPSDPGPANPGPTDPAPGDPADPEPAGPDPTPPGPTPPGPTPPIDDKPDAPAPGLSEKEIAKAAGGGAVARTRLDSLTLLIPKQFRMAKGRRTLLLGVATEQAGRLSVQLVRNGRAAARIKRSIQPGSAKQALRLPRRMRAGTYKLKVSFTRSGASWAASTAAKIRFVAAGR